MRDPRLRAGTGKFPRAVNTWRSLTARTIQRCVALGGGALVCSILATGAAERSLLWQIGQSNRSGGEFALAGNYRAFEARFGREPLVFEIGRGDASRDWPFVQPGPEDDWAGNHVHPFTVRFLLAEPPRGDCTLRVEFADVHAGARPTFLVSVGGRRAQFRLQPGGSESPLSHGASAKPQRIELAFPASLLHQGTNDIQLSAATGSWVVYDALTLWNDPQDGPEAAALLSLAAESTPFFVRRQGEVCRALNVKATSGSLLSSVELRVQAGGRTINLSIQEPIWFCGLSQEIGVKPPAGSLGSQHPPVFRLSDELGFSAVELGMPDCPEPVNAIISARAGNHTLRTPLKVLPEKKWKVFVGASSHTDIGYSDLQARCMERHNENTDLALDLMEAFPDFKWNLEVAWQAENYLAMRSGEKLERFGRLAREGRLGIQALYGNLLTGLCSHEAGCRLTSFARGLYGRYGLPGRSATLSDVPTQEASLPMLLAGAGIRYFSNGINNERAYPFTRMQELSPCWWEGPDGSRVLAMFAPRYAQADDWRLTRNLYAARACVPSRLDAFDRRRDYPYDAIWLHGAYMDNGRLTRDLAQTVKAWNDRYAFPKVILSLNDEFFEYIERGFAERLPVVRGSGGAYWEDGAGSSARETALGRNAQEALSRAETLLALARPLQPASAAYPASALATVWRNCLLYDEHIWGAYSLISQPDGESSKLEWATKVRYALEANAQAAALLQQGASQLASLVPADDSSLLVINASSWPRTGRTPGPPSRRRHRHRTECSGLPDARGHSVIGQRRAGLRLSHRQARPRIRARPPPRPNPPTALLSKVASTAWRSTPAVARLPACGTRSWAGSWSMFERRFLLTSISMWRAGRAAALWRMKKPPDQT